MASVSLKSNTRRMAQRSLKRIRWRGKKRRNFITCWIPKRLKPSIRAKPPWKTFLSKSWGRRYMTRVSALVAGEVQRLQKYHVLTANLIVLVIWMLIAAVLDEGQIKPFIPFI